MDETLRKLKNGIISFADGIRNGTVSPDDDEKINKIFSMLIEMAAEVYRNPDVKLLYPKDDFNNPYVYTEDEKHFVPLYSCREEINSHPGNCSEVSFKEIFDYVYENMCNYEMLDNPEYVLEHGISFSDLVEYADKNPRYEGIILDCEGEYPFSFEGWTLKAVIFKGMGVNEFQVIDAETGEVKHEV